MTQPTHEQAILAALPGTIPQIMKRSGSGRATVYLWLGRLHKASKVHIGGWRRTAGLQAPFYAVGEGVDKPRPRALTGAEHSRKHYRKHRRPIEIEMRAARKAARLSANAMAKKPNTWLSALGVTA